MADTDRPQDVGRRHRRKGAPSEATRLLLTEYHDAMRRELRAVLGELEPTTDGQIALDGKPAEPKRPKLETRARLWDLAIKLGRELGTAIDAGDGPADDTPATTARPRRRRVDFGGA